MTSSIQEMNHALVHHHLSGLRSTDSPPVAFRNHLRQLACLLAMSATHDLPMTEREIETPMAKMKARCLQGRIGIIPILRAGLGLSEPMLELIPQAEVWHLGVYRDEATAEPVEYYSRLDGSKAVDVALVVDPMLATGGSAVAAINRLKRWGTRDIRLLSVIAAPEGIARVGKDHPDVAIHVCSIDECLNDVHYIVPGLGDAGDRYFNTLGS